MDETAAILTVVEEKHANQDTNANKAIREVASTPSPEHVIPAFVVAFLYRHVDLMRGEFFGGQLPEVVLSFEVTDRRTLGHYLRRLSLGVRWALNLNPVHLARPVYQVLATLLHELGHAWQHQHGTPSKPPHHNKELREKCEAFGIPTDEGGHDLGVRHGSPFEAYCRRHGSRSRLRRTPSLNRMSARRSPRRSCRYHRCRRGARSSRSGRARAA